MTTGQSYAQRTPLTPHNSFRYKPFMANGTKFFSIWELVYHANCLAGRLRTLIASLRMYG